jgi:glycosyltransferase involved in cell wall biosynthesis
MPSTLPLTPPLKSSVTPIPIAVPLHATKLRYVLVTPARNEEALLEGTIRSVVAQTVRPARWIIVSDGSTDRTDEIARRYASQYDWIQLLRMPEHRDRQFASKANCFNAGYALLRETDYDIVGNLDADITFEPDYFEFLLRQFGQTPKLGVAGTPFVEDASHRSQHTYAHRFAQLDHVSGACQLFRKQCFEEVGGYVPIKGGAIDWIAVTTARMKGWQTRTFLERTCLHHRKIGTGTDSRLMAHFRYGQKAYYVGGHPLWELLRGVFRMRTKPLLLGGLYFQCGFLWAAVTRMKRPVSPELVSFHRAEQLARLRSSMARITRRDGGRRPCVTGSASLRSRNPAHADHKRG